MSTHRSYKCFATGLVTSLLVLGAWPAACPADEAMLGSLKGLSKKLVLNTDDLGPEIEKAGLKPEGLLEGLKEWTMAAGFEPGTAVLLGFVIAL